MRRPPDKDGHPGMSDKDVDSSNATLNTLFGGARQKAWMLGSVRPTPRGSIPKASSNQSMLAPRNMNAILLPPAPSYEPNSTVSQGSINGVHNHNIRQILNSESQYPPSIGTRSSQPAPQALSITQTHTGVPFFESQNVRVNHPSQSHTGSQAPGPASSTPPLPSTLISQDRPVGDSHTIFQPNPEVQSPRFPTINLEQRRQYGSTQRLPTQIQTRIPSFEPPNVGENRPSPTHTDSQAPRTASSTPSLPSILISQDRPVEDGRTMFPPDPELRSPSFPPDSPDQRQRHGSPQRSASRNRVHHLSLTTQQPAETQQGYVEKLWSSSPVEMTSSLPTMPFEQPPLPSTVLLPTPNRSRRVPSNPHKRQRIQVPVPPPLSLKAGVALINSHVDSMGGIQNLNYSLERPRFQLLLEACNTDDTFYAALHQLFCVWDSPARTVIATFQGLPGTPILAVAFRVLGQLIRDNEGLAPNHLKWFVDFPAPLVDLMRISAAYRQVVMNAGQFLRKLATGWAQLSRLWSTRGYPPLIDEMTNRMGLMSPILQQIMFTATRRNLGVSDDQYGEQMEKVFAQDRQGNQELAARFNTSRPPTEREIAEQNRVVVEKYLMIYNQRIQSRRVSGPVMGSPLAGSPTAPSQASLQRSASINSNEASFQTRTQNPNANQAMNQNFPSPDPWHQNQQIQHSRTTSANSPNPMQQNVAGRPPSITSHPVYSNIPSPTLLQELSMNSPVVQSPVMQQQWPGPAPGPRSDSVPLQTDQNATGYSNGNYNAIPQQQQHQQAAMQQPSVQQQLATQQHQRPQAVVQGGNQQWQQQANLHAYQQQYQQQQQAMQYQQPLQQMEQHRQQIAAQQIAVQHVQAMNRVAHLRNNGQLVDSQQRVHSGHSNTSRAGRSSSNANSPNLPLPRPIPSSNSELVAQNQVAIYNQVPPLERPLVPPLGFQQPAQPTNSDLTALHQAHLRSPRLIPESFAPNPPEEDPSRRFYQFVKGFALGPTKMSVTSSIAILDFLISEESFSLIPKERMIGTDRLPVREFKSGCLQYRLRCIQSKSTTTKCLVPDWIMSDTVWPEIVFLEINTKQLEVRRKNHHGKDLPVDITRFIVPKTSPENVNRIKISIPRLRKATKDICFFIAVEIIEVLQHPQIMKMVNHYQHISAPKTLDAIRKSLAPPPSDDDDLAMVVSDLSIDLADPFTARIFEIPVRGSSCLHRECFDLETFLLTRNSKFKRPNQPCMVDVWKCPLCGKDARPYSLQIDDFLSSVRAELEKADNLDAKAILVSADGSWRAKVEPRATKRKATGESPFSDVESSDGEGTARKQQAVARKRNPHLNSDGRAGAEMEVIELDDD